MIVKCFTKNEKGKIEFTQDVLEKLLNEVYSAGYSDGSNKHYWWSSPYYYNYCNKDYITTTSTSTTVTNDSSWLNDYLNTSTDNHYSNVKVEVDG